LDQIAKHLPRKHKALILNLTNAKKKKNQKFKKAKERNLCFIFQPIFLKSSTMEGTFNI
jgi:hypothetical protein